MLALGLSILVSTSPALAGKYICHYLTPMYSHTYWQGSYWFPCSGGSYVWCEAAAGYVDQTTWTCSGDVPCSHPCTLVYGVNQTFYNIACALVISCPDDETIIPPPYYEEGQHVPCEVCL